MDGTVRRGALAAAVLACGTLVLAGCGDRTRQALGIDKSPPDEFAVVTRAPLALPPNFQLRPPAPGTARPQEREVKDEARKTLIQSASISDAPNDGQVSSAENALLGRAGASNADASIRTKVDVESAEIAASQGDFIDKLIFWRKKDPPGEIIEANAEARRLRENAALGTPPVTGKTPIIERRERGWLEGIFN